jgi:magnesium chelatase subunit D
LRSILFKRQFRSVGGGGNKSLLLLVTMKAFLRQSLSFIVCLLGLMQGVVDVVAAFSNHAVLQTNKQMNGLRVTKPLVEGGHTQLDDHDDATLVYDDSFIRQAFQEHGSPQTSSATVPSDSTVRRSKEVLEGNIFPFSAIVNQEHIKQALILAATNPQLGLPGVLIAGGHGTCKSVLARAAKNLLPRELDIIHGNRFNIEPMAEQRKRGHPLLMDSFLKEELESDTDERGDELNSQETESIPMPFVTVPLNVMEESLLGSVDIEQSLETGKTCFSPGLLAKAHRGILYVDDINLLEEEVANILINALDKGFVTVEREGLSAQYPCKPQLVVATYNPDEGELNDSIVDRFAMSLSSEATPLSVEQRIQVVDNVEGFHPGDISENRDTLADTLSANGASVAGSMNANNNFLQDEEIRENILESKSLLPNVKIESSQILYLCEEATRAGCEGQRAEIFATEIAKTVAALHGRDKVTAEDLQYAVMLAIVSRARHPFLMEDESTETNAQQEQQQQQQPGDELQPLEPEPEMPPVDQSEVDDELESEDQNNNEEMQEDSADQAEQEEEEVLEIPQEFMFGVDFDTPIDPRVLHFQHKLTRKGKGGKRAKIFSISRGRFVKAIFPKAEKRGRLAIGATLRAAAPHQKIRREREAKQGVVKSSSRGLHHHPKVHIIKDDFRIQRMARKAGTLVIFVVDASGSMALNRMAAAKGAAMLLLKEAYKSRDKIALVAFHGSQAEVLVPPTKSTSMTKNRLESMPCGGGSPLAHALETAIRTGLNEIKIKRDVGRVILVLLTDGRANVPLSFSRGEPNAQNDDNIINGISSDRKLLREEVIALTKQLAVLPDFDLLCIDTEDKFVGTGIARDITKAALGTYHHLMGTADTKTVSHLVQKGLEEAKS